MLVLIARRVLFVIPVLIVVSFGVFSLQQLLPGDAATAIAGPNASPSQIEYVRDAMGLDKPFLSRYETWLSHAVRGDLGTSVLESQQGLTVSEQIEARFPITLTLALGALVIAILVSVPLAILGAMRRNGWADRLGRSTSTLGIAIPTFLLALILVQLFAVDARLLPVSGFVAFSTSPTQWFAHLIMPWISLGLFLAAATTRQLRQALIEVLESQYIRTAWAKGAGPTRVVCKHALKNAAIPATTVLAVGFAYALGGTVIIEQIFSFQGLGSYFLDAVTYRDFPVLLGVTMVFVIAFLIVTLLLDIVYGLLNPRVRVA